MQNIGNKIKMKFKHFIENSNSGFLLFLFSLFTLVLLNPLVIPLDSHYYVSSIEGLNNQSQILYNSIRTPIYEILGSYYFNYAPYFIISILSLFSLTFSFYFILYISSRKKNLSLAITFLLSPLTFWTLSHLSSLLNNQTLNKFFYAIYLYSPTHFGWSTVGFNTRQLSGILIIWTLYNFIRKNYVLSGFFILIGYLIHPNNFLSISIWLCLTQLIIDKKIFLKFYKKNIFYFLNCLGIIIVFLLTKFKVPKDISYYSFEWYENANVSNAPNFSIIHDLTENIFQVLLKFTIAIIMFVVAHRLSANNQNYKKVKTLIITPVIIIIIIIILELLVSNKVVDFQLFNRILISSQLGIKILELSFFPIAILISKIVHIPKTYLLKAHFVYYPIIFFLIVGGLIKDRFQLHYNAIKSNYDYETILVKRADDSGVNPMILPISKIKKVSKKYNKKFSDLNDFLKLRKKIFKKVPINSIIITPPYQDLFRDLLREYDIFYQDVPDSSIYFAGGYVSREIDKRRELLFNKRINSFPKYSSGLYFGKLREEYLNLKKSTLQLIKKAYPNDSIFFLTESNIYYDLELIAKNKGYSLYKIN